MPTGKPYIGEVGGEMGAWAAFTEEPEPAPENDPGLFNPGLADALDRNQNWRETPQTFVRDTPKIGRNDPCHCGSGLKYKKCHGAA